MISFSGWVGYYAANSGTIDQVYSRTGFDLNLPISRCASSPVAINSPQLTSFQRNQNRLAPASDGPMAGGSGEGSALCVIAVDSNRFIARKVKELGVLR